MSRTRRAEITDVPGCGQLWHYEAEHVHMSGMPPEGWLVVSTYNELALREYFFCPDHALSHEAARDAIIGAAVALP